MAELNLNLSGYQAYDTCELLPPGEYAVRIAECELRTARSSGVQYLNLRYDIIDGAKVGRCVFDSLNLWSNNPNAREIAGRKLKSIAQAIRLPNPDIVRDTDELLNGEMLVRVAVRKDPGYEDKNDVKGYKPLPGVAVAPAAAPVPPAAAPAAPQPRQQTPWG